MFYVYLLRSKSHPAQKYIGVTSDLKKRISEHNIGKSTHTNKFKPRTLVTYVAFESEDKAENFEKYLKHGSGHAFANRHLW